MTTNLKVLDEKEYKTMVAFAKTLIPSGDNPRVDPGANDIKAVNFIDSLLADDKQSLQGNIKDYIKDLDKLTLKNYNKTFTDLSEKQKMKFLKLFEKEKFLAFSWLRRLVLSSFYSNYRPKGYKGKTIWETIGYLGPMTWPEMSWSMSNPVYNKEQEDKEAVQL